MFASLSIAFASDGGIEIEMGWFLLPFFFGRAMPYTYRGTMRFVKLFHYYFNKFYKIINLILAHFGTMHNYITHNANKANIMTKKTAKKIAKKEWAKKRQRAEGNTTMGVSTHKTRAIMSFLAARREGTKRSAWLSDLIDARIEQMRSMPKYAKDFDGVELVYSPQEKLYVYKIPQRLMDEYDEATEHLKK